MAIERDAVYRIGEVAKILSVSESTVRNFMKDGLPHKKIRSIVFIRGDELLTFMSAELETKSNPKLIKFQMNRAQG